MRRRALARRGRPPARARRAPRPRVPRSAGAGPRRGTPSPPPSAFAPARRPRPRGGTPRRRRHLALEHEPLGEREPGRALLLGERLAGRVDRLARERDGRRAVADRRGPPRLLRAQRRQVVRLRLRPEQPLGGVEVRPGLLRAAVLDQRPRAGDVRPGEVDGVLRGLEQRDRAAEVVERVLRSALVAREAAERPVDAHLRVRVDEGLHLGEDVVEDALGAVEVAEVGEGEAEVGREADARREVGRRLLLDHGDAALEELRGVGGAARHRVRAAQRPEDVGAQRRRDVVLLHGPLERRDGVGGAARLERREADRDPGAARGDDVAGLLGLGQQLAEPLVCRVGILREAQVELGLRQPQLAELVLAHVRAGLQVLGGDAELPRELAQRLDRRLPGPGLDPRDVGVRDAGGRELSLGQAALGPEPP